MQNDLLENAEVVLLSELKPGDLFIIYSRTHHTNNIMMLLSRRFTLSLVERIAVLAFDDDQSSYITSLSSCEFVQIVSSLKD